MGKTRFQSKSGGQAIVMVTLALVAMAGMMGLAVDLGWSFFVEKEAQKAADGASMAAVIEAYQRLGSSSVSFTCPMSPSGYSSVYCQPAITDCGTVLGNAASNLANGCNYASDNGFTAGGLGGKQNVTIQADGGGNLPPTAQGVNDIRYWVTVRTVQSVPQLFSAILGNRDGLVTSISTAGLVSQVVPGSFYGLNREGDYMIDTNGTRVNYGVDVTVQGSQGGGQNNCPGSSSPATICAADGMYLASQCNGTSNISGCTDGGNRQNYAGETQGSANVWGKTVQIRGVGNVDDCAAGPTICGSTPHWTPTPTNQASPTYANDPTQGKSQPPLVRSTPFASCGVLNGQIQGTSGNSAPQQLGPYQYYSYQNGPNGTRILDGQPITVTGSVQFTSSGTCPNNGPVDSGLSPDSGSFPQYVFYGGMNIPTSANVNFGSGQYVMAGQSNSAGSVFNLPSGSPTVSGSAGAGTLFIFTDANYSGSGTSLSAVRSGTALQNATISNNIAGNNVALTSALQQGSIDLKTGNSASVTLNGVVKGTAPSSLDQYNGFVFWQDRRNSVVNYDLNPDLGKVTGSPAQSTNQQMTARNVRFGSNPSPALNYAASVPLALNGVIYQPRGAFIRFGPGNSNINAALRIITGGIWSTGGGQVQLLPTAVPITTYAPALIQ